MEEIIKKGLNELRTLYSKDEENLEQEDLDKKYELCENAFTSFYNNHRSEFTQEDKEELARIIYDNHIDSINWAKINKGNKTKKVPPKGFYDACLFITKILEQKDRSKRVYRCYYTKAVMDTLRYYNDLKVPEIVLELTDLLDPTLLSTYAESYIHPNGGEPKYFNEKENWYSFRSNALLGLEEYEECIDLLTECINIIPPEKFSDKNRDSMIYRRGKAYLALEDYNNALNDFIAFTENNITWEVYYRIAHIYFIKDKIEESLSYALSSALIFGAIENKTNLYKLIVNILDLKGEGELADKHCHLIWAIKKKRKNKISLELEQRANKYILDEKVSYKSIEKNLRPLWEDLKYCNRSRLEGTINSFSKNGLSTIIKDETIFPFDIRCLSEEVYDNLKKGLEVSFVSDSFYDKEEHDVVSGAFCIRLM